MEHGFLSIYEPFEAMKILVWKFCGERHKYFRTLLNKFENWKRLKLHIRGKIQAEDFWTEGTERRENGNIKK